jgi:deaminated glutathione amidase
VAAIQMCSTADRERNLAVASRLVRRAADGGAELIALPENFSYLHSEGTRVPCAEPLDGPLGRWLRDLARETGRWLLAGSVPESIVGSRRIHNTSVLYSAEGRRAATYRKIHLFDVHLKGAVDLQESRTVTPGTRTTLARTPLGNLGLTVCYDLRFPEVYRRLALRGAQVLFVPSAFTGYTGPFHWRTLLRARAIENTCYVVAPAQFGQHSAKRHSHGHTMIIDPWGEVLAHKARGAGIVFATIDRAHLEKVRAGMPTLRHTKIHL